MDILTLILGWLLWFIVGIFIMRIVSLHEHRWVRKQATQGSRSAIFGEVYEKILPALPNFPYAPKDMVFIGKGCDYIIFDWLSEWSLREIVFLELKSGNATLNKNEKAIQYLVDHRRVRFSEYRIDSVRNKE
jgi:predicted Holliday junction resolvase-like endonuclease